MNAALAAVLSQGASVSLDSIASSAGVSKSGVIHHFPVKEDLLRAVVRDSLETLRERVHGHVDLSENHPGKLLRAYIRALHDVGDEDRVQHPGTWRFLDSVEGVPEMMQSEADFWRESFAADGLPADLILVAQAAAEGAAASAAWDRSWADSKTREAREAILALLDTGAITRGSPGTAARRQGSGSEQEQH